MANVNTNNLFEKTKNKTPSEEFQNPVAKS